MKSGFIILSIMFFSKLMVNALLPIFGELHLLKMKKVGGKPPGNVSMAPIFEIVLLLLLAVTAYFDPQNRWSPIEIVGYGICAVLASYVACVVVACLSRKLWP